MCPDCPAELDNGCCPNCGYNRDFTPARRAGRDSRPSPGYAVHIDGTTGEIDPATQAALDKMAALLRKKELIRTGNAGVDGLGRIVDIREQPDAVRLPPHNDAHELPHE